MKFALLMILMIIICTIPCVLGEYEKDYPYSIEENGEISASLVAYLEKSTADADLLEICPDGDHYRINFDKQRKPFRVIGICNYPNGTIEEINKMAKEKIYTPRFSSSSTEPYVKGLEVHSGHITRDGNETFIPFHYLVYPDGNEVKMFDQPLINTDGLWKVNQVPWAMGNWDMNCETIAIAVLGNGNITREQNKTIDKLALSLKGYNPSARIVSRISK